jgi:hypothetical protein
MIQYQEYMIADLLASKEKLVKIPLGTLPLESSQFSFEMTMEKQSVTVGDLTLEIIEE